jgi:hypothetical protein
MMMLTCEVLCVLLFCILGALHDCIYILYILIMSYYLFNWVVLHLIGCSLGYNFVVLLNGFDFLVSCIQL